MSGPLYPKVILSNPEASSVRSSSSSSSMYPSVDMNTVAKNAFPDDGSPGRELSTEEQVLIRIPGAIVHLIGHDNSVELASGDLAVVGLRQGNNVVAVLLRVGKDAIQWPLARDEPAVKLDQSHYFFTLRVPSDESGQIDPETEPDQEPGGFEVLNYGVTIASKGQEALLDKLDGILGQYSCFTVQAVEGKLEGWEVVAREVSPAEMGLKERRDKVAGSSGAYWTALAPNVEDYSSRAARMIAGGSGQMIRGIIWCGDVTVDGLRWGNEVLKGRLSPAEGSSDVSPATMRRIKRVKKLTKTTESVAVGILSGVVRVSGFFTSSIVNSAVGKKFFSLLPGEIVLASLDGFNKICDAVEVAGKSVMSTTSVVTTGLVSQKYGEEAGEVTTEGMDAAGHAIGTAWAVFKIRKAINPKSVLKPATLAKAAAAAQAKADKQKRGS